jgi:hypothetical protein
MLMRTVLFLAVTQSVIQFIIDVSGQSIGPIFKGQESKKSSGNFIPVSADNLSVPSSRALEMGPIASPETSVRNYHYLLLNSPEERSSHIWLNSVDRFVFHFCLNSGNIRDTL